MYEYKFKLVRVVDGDTVIGDIDLGFDVVLTNKTIRLRGLDTPETRTRNKDEKAFGLFVKRYVQIRFEHAEELKIRTYKDKNEKYGRVLGELIINGVDLNEELLAKKYALPYGSGSKDLLLEQHLENWEDIGVGLI